VTRGSKPFQEGGRKKKYFKKKKKKGWVFLK
jgi:hypothetical protein